MDRIYLAHGGREVVVGGRVTFEEGASIAGGIIDFVPVSNAVNIAALRSDFNRLLNAIRVAGLMRPAFPETQEPVKTEDEGIDNILDASVEPGDAP